MPEEAVLETDETLEQPVDTADAEIPADDVAQDVSADEVDAGGGEAAPEVSTGADQEWAQELARTHGVEYGGDPQSLVRHLALSFDSRLAQLGRQLSQPANGHQTNAQQAQQTPSGLELEKLIGELLPESEVDPTLRKGVQSLFAKVVDHFGQQQNALKDELGSTHAKRFEALESILQEQEQAQTTAQLDGFFSGLGKEWSGDFGAGPMSASLAARHIEARNGVVQEAIALREGYKALGMPSPKLDQLMKRALNARYADKHTTIARKQIVNEVAQKRTQALTPAGRKRTTGATPAERAAQTWKEGLKKLGIRETDGGDE